MHHHTRISLRGHARWLLTIALIFTVNQAEAADFAFVGGDSCRKCHRAVFKSWQETGKARTLDILKPGERAEAKRQAGLDPARDYSRDTACLSCHVTGFGKEGGFVSLEKTPDLAGIGCEACHGAGAAYNLVMEKRGRIYAAEEVEQAGMVREVRSSCAACHNEKSPTHRFKPPFQAKDYPWPGHDEIKLKYHTPEYQVNK